MLTTTTLTALTVTVHRIRYQHLKHLLSHKQQVTSTVLSLETLEAQSQITDRRDCPYSSDQSDQGLVTYENGTIGSDGK